MAAKILSGLAVQEEIAKNLKSRVLKLSTKPQLVVISIGEEADSESYIKAKRSFADKIGIIFTRKCLSSTTNVSELNLLIESLNLDPLIHGIIVQLPLPDGFNVAEILDKVVPSKDVDALSSYWLQRFYVGEKDVLIPATARGVLSLLKYYSISISGKNAVVVGRSSYVGKPVAEALRRAGAKVFVAHRGTVDFPKVARAADILVSIAGSPNLIGKDSVREGQTVIDVGITSEPPTSTESGARRKIKGDVDFESVKDIVGAISPVPGGVGPLTVASLFENLLDLIERKSAVVR